MVVYRVLPGCVHGAQGQYKAGDLVELDPQDAEGFLDKLELVVEEKPPERPANDEPLIPPEGGEGEQGGEESGDASSSADAPPPVEPPAAEEAKETKPGPSSKGKKGKK